MRRGFAQGRIAAADIDGMIWGYRTLKNTELTDLYNRGEFEAGFDLGRSSATKNAGEKKAPLAERLAGKPGLSGFAASLACFLITS